MRRPVVSSRSTKKLVGRGGVSVTPSAQHRFERYDRFLYKQAEQGIAVSHAAKVTSMADEYPSLSPQTFKGVLELGRWCCAIAYHQ